MEHTVEELVTQRVMALALGYQDLNDHDTLRRDPVVAAVVGKMDPTGALRLRAADRGAALAGKSTLNRLELAGPGAATDRYKKVRYDQAALDALLADLFIESHARPPARIVLDVDATDDPLHGQQGGAVLPRLLPALLLLAAVHLLRRPRAVRPLAAGEYRRRGGGGGTRARGGSGAAGVAACSILVRGDAGFCREPLLQWCEAEGVDYVIGLAKNERFEAADRA